MSAPAPRAPELALGVSTPSPLAVWLMACRPKTLPAAVVGVLVGSACAWQQGFFRALPSLAALLGALLLQIGSNFANDVFDFEKGADNAARVGPTRAVQAGLISPASMKRGMLIVFALASLVGVYLASVAGPLIVGIGLASIVAAIAYTGGPYPLGYHGLGEVFVFLFFGLVSVSATVYLNGAQVGGVALALACKVGALASAILVVNNVRDHETDRESGKRTLVVRLGRSAGVLEYAGLLSIGYLIPIALVLTGSLSGWTLLPLLMLPRAAQLFRELGTERDARLNRTLAGTAQLLLLDGVLTCAGLLL